MMRDGPRLGGIVYGGLVALALVTALGLAFVAWWLSGPPDAGGVDAGLSLAETLGGADTLGYERAVEVRPFRFPEDHGPHPDFRTEWWYLTGNLEGADGRRFGYQLTLFRNALAPPGALDGPETGRGGSDWATRQAWMGHFALTDVGAGRFHAFDRFDRGALGLAGATSGPIRVWIGDWELRGGDEGFMPLRVRAAEAEVTLELELRPLKPPVMQGEGGLSRKGPEPGNASYYYSYTRLAATGWVGTSRGRVPVTGTTWLDREWSTSALPDGVLGWDWFALQLDDGRDLMVYGLRRRDGTFHPASAGVLVDRAGEVRRLERDDFSVQVLERWASPVDGAEYPSAWRVTVPVDGMELDVRPVLADQELRLAFRYWEGAVDVRGRSAGGRTTGRGYVELTGYAGAEAPTR